jgi:hypothetical protein
MWRRSAARRVRIVLTQINMSRNGNRKLFNVPR